MRCRLVQLSRQNSDDYMLTQTANLSPTRARPVNGNNQNGNNGESVALVVMDNGQGCQNGSVIKAETHTAPEKVNEIRPFNANVRVQVSHV